MAYSHVLRVEGSEDEAQSIFANSIVANSNYRATYSGNSEERISATRTSVKSKEKTLLLVLANRWRNMMAYSHVLRELHGKNFSDTHVGKE
jgi:DNA-binding response OmpR family regulator